MARLHESPSGEHPKLGHHPPARRTLVDVFTTGKPYRSGHADQVLLAHDVRNYLAPLTSRLELLKQRATAEGRAGDVRDLARASGAVERLSRLVSDLLDVERLEQGLFEIVPQPVDLVALAQEVAQALGTPGSEVHVQGPQSLVAMADRERLRQALQNLVSNAIKHSPGGQPVVIRFSTDLHQGRELAHLDVVDQGEGIPPELLPKLFERFVTGSRASGLGLGLYLASRIAAAHGATLTASSRPGNGTTFRLTLPVNGPPERGVAA